ncbi:MAG: hypothetical protein ABSF98_19635 [Bryobacteraceae bacterium]
MIPLMLVFAGAGLASASTYNIKLLQTTNVHGTQLKAGEYRLDVDNGKAVFHRGKTIAEAPAKLATAERKYADTKFVYDRGSDGQLTLREIDLGGSTVRVVLED